MTYLPGDLVKANGREGRVVAVVDSMLVVVTVGDPFKRPQLVASLVAVHPDRIEFIEKRP